MLFLIFILKNQNAQQLCSEFEEPKCINFTGSPGKPDANFSNSFPNLGNQSSLCCQFMQGTSPSEVIKVITILFSQGSRIKEPYYVEDFFWLFEKPLENYNTGKKLADKLKVLPIKHNTARESIQFQFYLPTSDKTEIELINLLGSPVFLHSEIYEKGIHTFELDLRNYEAGIYFLKIKKREFSISKKIIIDK